MRETVLLIGSPESVKTGSLIQVAVDNPWMPCYIFDAEASVERTAIFFGGVPKNLHIVRGAKGQVALNMEDMIWGMQNQVFPSCVGKPDGSCAVLINMLTNVEERASEVIAEAKSPGGLPQAISEAAEKNPKGVNPDFEPGEWKSLAAMVNYIVARSLYRLPAHVFITSEQKRIIERKDVKGVEFYATKDELKDIWAEYGAVPDANRHISFNMSTCIGVQASGLAVRSLRLSLVKDRSRVDFEPSVKFLKEQVPADEVRFKGTAKETNVFNIWKFLAKRVPGFVWPLPEVKL